ncbi:zeta toxin family protein [Flavisolibacter ginsenosidimutans]|uniref:zeta toxin family protein n=1 Tax=Flavisolibacter ginsenosidimutans TaxID=661481 RepID=UPI00155A918F|nr:zeta toxin family protein [Flavisolibacter ginsenosidimutans]
MSSTKPQSQLRLRVFAGPNGSGKSTVIHYVRNIKVKKHFIDFGYYINADDIAVQLRSNSFSFAAFDLNVKPKEFTEVVLLSGLIGNEFSLADFQSAFSLRNNILRLKTPAAAERLAQIVADFLRKKLLEEQKKFSFETVFSHPSKLEIMRQAAEAGYKVYLYFVSTESPEINKFRVKARKAKNGHDVPEDKIVSRYYRSLDLLFDACQLAYQVFFFDNSVDGENSVMFAHFKSGGGKKKWDRIQKSGVPEWFKKYYSDKVR